MKRPRLIALMVFAIGLAALIALTLRTHRDPRLERLIGWHTRLRNHREVAIEREVVEAELASYGPELIPALRQELDAGSVWRTKLGLWIETKSPPFIARYLAQKHFDAERRRELAALCLGRLGSQASITFRQWSALRKNIPVESSLWLAQADGQRRNDLRCAAGR